MIVPIFIYRDRPSKEEMREEAIRHRRMMDAIREDEERERRRKETEKALKRMEERKKAEEADRIYREERAKNPLDYSFLPEGWTIFGSNLSVINEDLL